MKEWVGRQCGKKARARLKLLLRNSCGFNAQRVAVY
jgi:hypothetical protein